MEEYFINLLHAFSTPGYGLSVVFTTSFLAATVIPLTPTPVVAALIKLNPSLFWLTIIIATLGNTLGGAVDWWMGKGAKNIHEKVTEKKNTYGKVMLWLQKFGPKTCLLAWVPFIGDPLCVAAGWLKLPFWPCMAYMAIGRFGRFLFIGTAIALLWPGAYPL